MHVKNIKNKANLGTYAPLMTEKNYSHPQPINQILYKGVSTGTYENLFQFKAGWWSFSLWII